MVSLQDAKINVLQQSLKDDIGDVVVAIGTVFVILSQAGFALLECGMSRSRNVYTVLVRTYILFFEVCIIYWMIGYTFSFSTGNYFLGYNDYWFGLNLEDRDYSTLLFGLSVCALSNSIVVTSFVERANFKAFLLITFFSVAFFHPVAIHWAWQTQGWLVTYLDWRAFKDFGGSGVLHIYSGVVGMVGCSILRPRTSRFKIDQYNRSPKPFHGHSKPFVFLGGMLVTSGLMMLRLMAVYQNHGNKSIKTGLLVMINSLLSSSFSALTVSLITAMVDYCGIACCKMRGRHDWFQLLVLVNSSIGGMVTGLIYLVLVSVSGCCDEVFTWSAVVIGTIGGCVYFTWSLLIRSCRVDDPLDVTAVHLGCGLWGILAAPLFSTSGFIYQSGSGNLKWFAWNLVGGLSILVWGALPFLLLFAFMKFVGFFRISADREIRGLDTYHGEMAYNILVTAALNEDDKDRLSNVGSVRKPIPGPGSESGRSVRRRTSIQWNIPPPTYTRQSIGHSWKPEGTPYYNSMLKRNTPSEEPFVSHLPPSRYPDVPINAHHHWPRPSTGWWEDPGTGGFYYGGRGREWGSLPNLNRAHRSSHPF